MKLTYFDLYGRAECLRMMFSYNKVDFEDNRIPQSDFPALKPTLDFGVLPLLEVEDRKISQTNAILRFLGTHYSLYPADMEAAYMVDSAIDLCDDLFGALIRASFTPDEDLKTRMFSQLMASKIPQVLGALEKRLKQNSCQVRIVGDTLTIADFKWAGLAYSLFMNEHNP